MPTNPIDSAFRRWLPSSRTPVIAPGVAAPEALVTAKTDTEKVTSALSLDVPDECPYCQAQMKPCVAVGIEVLMCDKDRHVAPMPNASEE